MSPRRAVLWKPSRDERLRTLLHRMALVSARAATRAPEARPA